MGISTHVLNTSLGQPASGVDVALDRMALEAVDDLSQVHAPRHFCRAINRPIRASTASALQPALTSPTSAQPRCIPKSRCTSKCAPASSTTICHCL